VGSRAADKLKEIEELLASLGAKLNEIEHRLPLAGFGKKIAAAVAGSSVAGSALGFGLRRMRGNRKKKKRAAKQDQLPVAPAVVNVNVFPKGAAYLAAIGFAGWAGYKVYDALQKTKKPASGESFKPAIVPPVQAPGRQAGI
jgi:hypothetical protein